MSTEIEPQYQNMVNKGPEDYLKLRISNAVAFIGCMIINRYSFKVNKSNQSESARQIDLKIQPAYWAFSIWGPIYFMVLVYVIYQLFQKNRESYKLLFNKIGFYFIINQISTGCWQYTFNQHTTVCYWVSNIFMQGIFHSCFKIMEAALYEPTNCIEFMTLRVGFSVYTGWVSTASVLNVAIALKSSGIDQSVVDEVISSIILLYVIWIAYAYISIKLKNPLYSAVLIWVLFSIKSRQQQNNIDGQLDPLITNLSILAQIQIVQVILHFAVLINQKYIQKKQMTHGLFY